MTELQKDLNAAQRKSGWHAFRDKDCSDRYLVGIPPTSPESEAETLQDISAPGGTIYGWEAIGTMVFVTQWMNLNPRRELYNDKGERIAGREYVWPVYNSAYWFKTITVADPETGDDVEVSLYRHDNGAVFGIDSSFLVDNSDDFETVDAEDPDSDAIIMDPFQKAHEHPNELKVRLLESSESET